MKEVNRKHVLDWKKKYNLAFINNVGVRKQDQLGQALQLGNEHLRCVLVNYISICFLTISQKRNFF